MVAIVAAVGAIFALVAGLGVFEKFVKPRLPVYTLQVQSLPRVRWIQEQGMYKTQLPTRVQLFNENYVPIDIHALQFDVFYSTPVAVSGYWWGRGGGGGQDNENGNGGVTTTNGSGASRRQLQHLGHVQDRHQQNLASTKSHPSCLASTSNSTSTTTTTTTTITPNKKVWQIGPRADFDCQDEIYFGTASTVPRFLAHAMNLAGQWLWQQWAKDDFILPTTGVAHVQTAAAKFTISLICDNRIDVWNMQVQGVECDLHAVQPGFGSLEQAAAQVKQYVLQRRQPHPQTGGLLIPTTTDAADSSSSQNRQQRVWKDLLRALEQKKTVR